MGGEPTGHVHESNNGHWAIPAFTKLPLYHLNCPRFPSHFKQQTEALFVHHRPSSLPKEGPKCPQQINTKKSVRPNTGGAMQAQLTTGK
jgi:hypothetical protein